MPCCGAVQDIDADASCGQLPRPKRRRTSAEGAPPSEPPSAPAAPADSHADDGEAQEEPGARRSSEEEAPPLPHFAGCLSGEAAKARWARVCAAFPALEGAYFGRRDAALRQAVGARPPASAPAAPAAPVAAPGAQAGAVVAGGSAARSAVGEHLAAFSDDLSKFALHTRLKVRPCPGRSACLAGAAASLAAGSGTSCSPPKPGADPRMLCGR